MIALSHEVSMPVIVRERKRDASPYPVKKTNTTKTDLVVFA
jgi:hypothetical protein